MRRLLITSILFLISTPTFANSLQRVAFYYGNTVPVDALHAYQIVVVDPHANFSPKKFNTAHSKAFAYVSLGEVNRKSRYWKSIKKRWILGRNRAWNSAIINQDNPHWRQYFINHIITPLWQHGYHGFFIDTLDSYRLVTTSQKSRAAQVAGMLQTIKQIKRRYPCCKS